MADKSNDRTISEREHLWAIIQFFKEDNHICKANLRSQKYCHAKMFD